MIKLLTFLLAVATGARAFAQIAPSPQDVVLPKGPPIADISTPFDAALMCLKERVNKSLTFSVGAILDLTGKEQITEGGFGKFVTQGAGDIVQSALFKAGLTVLNRRDPRVLEAELKWGVQNPREVIPSNFFITGSINSLDFIPGGGVDASVAGVGGRYRQSRILVGLDLSLTDATTSRVVANIPIQKQIFTDEVGLGIGRFFGDTLVTLDAGWREREALQFALRQMLNLATFELLTQLMQPENFGPCREQISELHGNLERSPSAIALQEYRQRTSSRLVSETPGEIALEAIQEPARPELAVSVKPIE